MEIVESARDLALLALRDLPERWRHTEGVAGRAGELSAGLPPEDRETLIAAAWLHDIGYAGVAHDTGFHPLDGARLLSRCGWSPRLAGLVAYHSGAWFVAVELGLADQLDLFPRESGPVADALTYADQTVGPAGVTMTVHQRMAEMLDRHGADSANARAHRRRRAYLLEVAARVEGRLVGV